MTSGPNPAEALAIQVGQLKNALETVNGKLTEVSAKFDALAARVEELEKTGSMPAGVIDAGNF